MSKRMNLVQNCVVFKSDSSQKQISFFVFNFNVSNKIASTPTGLINFQEFSNPSFIPTPPLIKLGRLSNPSIHSNPPPHVLDIQK